MCLRPTQFEYIDDGNEDDQTEDNMNVEEAISVESDEMTEVQDNTHNRWAFLLAWKEAWRRKEYYERATLAISHSITVMEESKQFLTNVNARRHAERRIFGVTDMLLSLQRQMRENNMRFYALDQEWNEYYPTDQKEEAKASTPSKTVKFRIFTFQDERPFESSVLITNRWE